MPRTRLPEGLDFWQNARISLLPAAAGRFDMAILVYTTTLWTIIAYDHSLHNNLPCLQGIHDWFYPQTMISLINWVTDQSVNEFTTTSKGS